MLSQPPTYLKAIVSGAVAFLATLAGAITTDMKLSDIALVTWLTAIIALLTGFSTVYFAVNSAPK